MRCALCVSGFGYCFDPTIPGWGVGVCVLMCALRLYPANPGWGSSCVWLGMGFGLHATNPGWGVGLCVFVCELRLYPANPGWGVRCGCVCFGLSFGCTLPFLALVLWCVCVCVRAPPVPRKSWSLHLHLGVCVWGLGFTSPILVELLGSRCLFARSACSAPFLAWVCSVGV